MKFKEAQEAMVNQFDSPTFHERIKEEDPIMFKHIPLLKKINRAGMITFNSQSGQKISGLSADDHKPYTIIERAYLFGWMKIEEAASFIFQLGISTDKQAIYLPMVSDNTLLPGSLAVPFTITITGKRTENTTRGSSALPERVYIQLKAESRLNKSEKVVAVMCWDPKWNRNASGPRGLFSDVLKVLRSI